MSSIYDDFDMDSLEGDIPTDERTIWDGPDAPTMENMKRKLIDERANEIDRQIKAYLTALGNHVRTGGDPLEFAADIYDQLQRAKVYAARARKSLVDDWGCCPNCFHQMENWDDQGYMYCTRTGCEWTAGPTDDKMDDENDFG